MNNERTPAEGKCPLVTTHINDANELTDYLREQCEAHRQVTIRWSDTAAAWEITVAGYEI